MDKEKSLQEIFDSDPLGILEVKAVSSSSKSEDERLIASFQEINDFVEKHGRNPEQGKGIQEHQLYSRLSSIRTNPSKVNVLNVFDKYGLLKYQPKEYTSIDDILSDDSLGLLDDDTTGLFELKHVPHPDERESADFIARRKVCKDFGKYEPLFKACQSELKNGKRKLIKFNENQIQVGAFFVLNGILVYVDKLMDITTDRFGKRDGRTKLIFENGTESNMLFRSLGKGLFLNGQGITFTNEESNTTFQREYSDVTEEDEESGYIYILKSLSEKKEIREIQHLYKIGFSTTRVEDRIKNATEEPTYLMADVRVVMAYQCFNMNPHRLENLLHTFFGSSCLEIEVYDKQGLKHRPREWFIAPLSIIEQAVHLIISGDIVKYRYDSFKDAIVAR